MKNKAIATPKPASSILVVRDGERGVEVLMIERAKTMKFAPGAFVFPGGKVDAADGDRAFWDRFVNTEADLPDLPYRVAALRELYEEAELMLTTEPVSKETRGIQFRARLAHEGAQLNVANMVPFAHWVTPEPMPRRFDTHFYIAAHSGGEARHDGNEAISMRWVCPRSLLHDWDNDLVPLMFPTRLNLMKLARADTVAEALEQAEEAPVVRTLPVLAQGADGVRVTIDPSCGYDVLEASPKELSVESSR